MAICHLWVPLAQLSYDFIKHWLVVILVVPQHQRVINQCGSKCAQPEKKPALLTQHDAVHLNRSFNLTA